ncbi:hypothetical protein [Pedobacter sp. UBA5917]|jgi:hypothetical protein|uniref:hypothetical protein n=1 Tax=Pedobacter sp. UBA5917 TaxID=1947061 RepID=UPI0025F8E04C|nr:hypothetical protein [Pedobacter sp. UBA5917]
MNQHTPTGLVTYQEYFFGSNFLDNCYFEIKRPADCSITELHYFYLLLRKGNKVSPIDLPLKILGAEFLGFCYQDKKLVGISAIKKPSLSYLENVHRKAGIRSSINEPFLEVGYSYTLTLFRQKGISSTLKRMLLQKITHYGGILFSTTATRSSQRFLLNNGFRTYGNPYQGIYDHNIVYFERNIRL